MYKDSTSLPVIALSDGLLSFLDDDSVPIAPKSVASGEEPWLYLSYQVQWLWVPLVSPRLSALPLRSR